MQAQLKECSYDNAVHHKRAPPTPLFHILLSIYVLLTFWEEKSLLTQGLLDNFQGCLSSLCLLSAAHRNK